METLKKFIRYYAPYKTVFFLDLICAAIISIVDLIYPQLLRSLAATLFTRESSVTWNGTCASSCSIIMKSFPFPIMIRTIPAR